MRKTMLAPLALGALSAALSLPASACGQQPATARHPDVPYVPTPPEVVEAMLRVAKVTRNDVLYDLGSGDGRIVIAAAKTYGVRGTGIDIDPRRVAEATENARKEGVTDRARFRQADIFESDFSDATVVTLYLLPGINLRLRPTLLKMRPGTRIVSHAFDMDEWEPDTSFFADGRRVLYWVVPADAAGTWEWTSPAGGAPRRFTIRLSQAFQKLGGTARTGGDSLSLGNPRLVGDSVGFTLTHRTASARGGAVQMRFAGRIRGDSITGTVTTGDGASARAQPWRATRTGRR